jgi:Pyridoxamine 5'-phosphate oxidase
MARTGIDDLEDLHALRLDDQGRQELLDIATECVFTFANPVGWPSGVVMSFLYADGCLWLTAVAGRAHAEAIKRDPRVTVVVSNAGTRLPGRRMVALRGVAFLHADEQTKRWFLPRFARKLAPADPEAFVRLLDSPERVVVEVRPVQVTASHDSRKMPGDGRGGQGRPDPSPSDTRERNLA